MKLLCEVRTLAHCNSGGDFFLKVFFFSIFSSGHHFVLPSGAILVFLVEGHWWNTSMQIF